MHKTRFFHILGSIYSYINRTNIVVFKVSDFFTWVFIANAFFLRFFHNKVVVVPSGIGAKFQIVCMYLRGDE